MTKHEYSDTKKDMGKLDGVEICKVPVDEKSPSKARRQVRV